MKTSRVVSVLRNTFCFLEWASAIFAVLIVVLSWVVAPYALAAPSTPKIGSGVSGWGPPIYRFRFDLPPLQTAAVDYRGTSNGSVMVTNLSAELLVSQAENPSRLLTFLRWRSMASSLLLALLCAIFSLVRRLFDNVKIGEAFSLKSVQLIRLMGWCCLISSITASVLNSVLDWSIASDLRQHLAINGLSTGFLSADTEGGINFFFGQLHLKLDLSTLLIGLLAFALAEVFRQGVLMKEEHELTV